MTISRRSRDPRRAWRRAAARRWTGTFPRALSALAAALAVTTAAPASAWAEDDWLVPGVLLAAQPPASPVSMVLYEGRDFVAEREVPLSSVRVARFLHVHHGGREDLLSFPDGGSQLPTSFDATEPGGHLLVLDDDAGVVELAAKDTDAYLRREGLGGIAAERARLGEADKPGRVRRLALLKAFLQVGRVRDSVFRRELGQALELRPLVDPTLVLGGGLSVALSFRDAPLAGARVELLSRLGARIARAQATTDADGVAALDVPAEGIHLIRAIHAVRCKGCQDAEWQSFLATYTFANGPAMLSGTLAAPSMLGPGGAAAGGAEGSTGAPPTFRSRRVQPMPDVETIAPAPPGMVITPERYAPRWPVTAAIVASVAATAVWLSMGRRQIRRSGLDDTLGS
jgi:hypothetical protein